MIRNIPCSPAGMVNPYVEPTAPNVMDPYNDAGLFETVTGIELGTNNAPLLAVEVLLVAVTCIHGRAYMSERLLTTWLYCVDVAGSPEANCCATVHGLIAVGLCADIISPYRKVLLVSNRPYVASSKSMK